MFSVGFAGVRPPTTGARNASIDNFRDDLAGFETRWSPRRKIRPPPRTPCADPFEFPFSKLRPRNENGTMTLDEELLRAIIGQFTVKAASSLPFWEIFEKLQRNNPHLTYLLFDDPDYVWAYIRCYPEQFVIDKDPRQPERVWYFSKCKVIAKTDRRRYERELPTIRATIEASNENADWDAVAFDDELERLSLVYVSAVFAQVQSKFPHEQLHLPGKFIKVVLKNSDAPSQLLDYIGDNVEQFLYRRAYYFIVFGSQVSQRSENFVGTLRSLTNHLLAIGGACEVRKFYDFFMSSPFLKCQGVRAIDPDATNFLYDDFLMFLFGQKLLFRLRPRQLIVQLRHGAVPEINRCQIDHISTFKIVDNMKSCDLEYFEGDDEGKNESSWNGFGAGFKADVTSASFYTMRWLTDNFSSTCSTKVDSMDDDNLFNELCIMDRNRGVLSSRTRQKESDEVDGWPELKNCATVTADTTTSSGRSRSVPSKGKEDFGATVITEFEWNGCF